MWIVLLSLTPCRSQKRKQPEPAHQSSSNGNGREEPSTEEEVGHLLFLSSGATMLRISCRKRMKDRESPRGQGRRREMRVAERTVSKWRRQRMAFGVEVWRRA